MNSSVKERPVAHSHGTFVLPGISKEVPVTLGTKSKAEQILARFALAAEEVGIPLTGGKYSGLKDTVKDQLESWLASLLTVHADFLNGTPGIDVGDSKITFFVEAGSNLNTIRLKPVIDRLEAVKAGLGWYVVRLLEMAPSHGMNIYGPALMGYESSGRMEGAETDEEFVEAMYEMEHGERPASDQMEKLLADAREDYGYMPSTLSDDVDGHVHLLGWTAKKGKRPTILRRKQVFSVVNQLPMEPDLLKCVQDALLLEKLQKDDKTYLFSWDPSDDAEQMGAVMFMAWDDQDMLLELTEHYETMQQECGTAIPWLMRISVEGEAPDIELKQMARALRVYFHQWNALATLASNFPRV